MFSFTEPIDDRMAIRKLNAGKNAVRQSRYRRSLCWGEKLEDRWLLTSDIAPFLVADLNNSGFLSDQTSIVAERETVTTALPDTLVMPAQSGFSSNIKAAANRGEPASQAGGFSASFGESDSAVDGFEDFETGDFNEFPWQRSSSPSGSNLWFISDATADSTSVHGGRFGAQAGDLADGQRTRLEVTVATGAGNISFWRKVSSEASFDFLEFYIDGTRRDRWAGELDWTSVSYPVGAGIHTFAWQYAKDYSISRGADTAWIDDIVFPSAEADTTRPTVSAVVPAGGASITSTSTNVNVTFSETVQGVDATDLVLSGAAAAAASVGAPTLQSGNTWRFPITGLANGPLNLSLAPDANDIEDLAGNDLVPAAWNYTVAVAPTSNVEDFETGGFAKFPWQQTSSPSGSNLWFISDAAATSTSAHSGRFGAQAGDLADGQRTRLEVTVATGAGSISFWRKVSSEASFDFLEFYIDGTRRDRWAGELDWTSVSYPVSAGIHTFAWQYAKDYSISRGADTAWIDDIVFPTLSGDTTRPTVSAVVPAGGASITSTSTNVNVTFSETVQGVDATDLVLSGAAAAAASVGARRFRAATHGGSRSRAWPTDHSI